MILKTSGKSYSVSISLMREQQALLSFARKNMVEGNDSARENFQPSERTKPEVWSYVGFYKRPDGNLIEDSHSVCRSCKKKVAAEGGNNSNLLSPII